MEGEMCCSWADSLEPLTGVFHGSERVDATFCCVACNLSYCCSSLEARLNQQLCLALQVDGGTGQVKRIAQPLTAKPAVPNIGWFFIAVVAAAVLAVCIYCCYNCYWEWMLSCDELERPREWDGAAPPGVTSLCQTLPRYVSSDPPAYSVEDPEDSRPEPPAPVVRFQHLYSRTPEDEAAPYSSAAIPCRTVSDPSLASSLEIESLV